MLKELYGPLVNKDKDKVQDIYYSGRAYYSKITLWYFFALVCISLIYCFTINSTIPANKVFLVVIFKWT